MKKIIMLKGLPKSGKTTWAKEQIKKGGYLRVGVDDIRQESLGGWSAKKEKVCLRMRDEMIRFGIKEGKNVIVDATNLNPKHEYRLRRLAEELGVRFVINDEFMGVSPEDCIRRDMYCGKEAVGSKIIWDMYEKWIRPKPEKVLENNSNKRRAVVIDLDGTLFNKQGEMCSLNLLLSFIIDCIYEAGDYYADIILISERLENERAQIESFLERNCIPYHRLYLSSENLREEDSKQEIIEEKIIPEYAILGIIDNSSRCCKLCYNMGINVLKAGNPVGDS